MPIFKSWFTAVFVGLFLFTVTASSPVFASPNRQVFLGIEGFPHEGNTDPQQIYKWPPEAVAALETLQANLVYEMKKRNAQNWLIYRRVEGGVGDKVELEVLEELYRNQHKNFKDSAYDWLTLWAQDNIATRVARIKDLLAAITGQKVKAQSTYFRYFDEIRGPQNCNLFDARSIWREYNQQFREKGKMPWYWFSDKVEFDLKAEYYLFWWDCLDNKIAQDNQENLSRIDWEKLALKKLGVLAASFDEAFEKGWELDSHLIIKSGEEMKKDFELYKNRTIPFEDFKKEDKEAEQKCQIEDGENDHIDLSGKRGREKSSDLKSVTISQVEEGVRVEITTYGNIMEGSRRGSISYEVAFTQGKTLYSVFILDVTNGKIQGFRENRDEASANIYKPTKWTPINAQINFSTVTFIIPKSDLTAYLKYPTRINSSFAGSSGVETDFMSNERIKKCSY